eukprot:8028578-Alexandrium_andersonii.AAC.1
MAVVLFPSAAHRPFGRKADASRSKVPRQDGATAPPFSPPLARAASPGEGLLPPGSPPKAPLARWRRFFGGPGA